MSDSMNAIDVPYQTQISIENKSMEQLAGEINTGYHQAESLARMSYMYLADAGRKLIEVKGRLQHGQFENWCANNLEFSKSKAEKCMKLAKRINDENSLFSKTETFTDIEISTVWALLAAPEEVAAEVIETHDVSDMTVRELKEEISRLKEEKEAAENEKSMAEGSNDNLRKELASAQRKLSEVVTEEEFNSMRKEYEEANKTLQEEIERAKAEASEEIEKVNQKLEKAKENLKKEKEKVKEIENSKDEEIQKRLAEAGTEIEEKARADAQKEAENALKEKADTIQALETQISALEAEKEKLSNTALMEFKVLADQLQDTYHKIVELIERQEEELAQKMHQALNKLTEEWK